MPENNQSHDSFNTETSPQGLPLPTLLGVVIPRNLGAQAVESSNVLDTLSSWPWALRGRLLLMTRHTSYRDFLQSVAAVRVDALGATTLATAEEVITRLGLLLSLNQGYLGSAV